MKDTIKKSIIGGLIFSITSLTVFVVYAASTLTATTNEALTATKWNNMVSMLSIPSGAIMAFNLSSCPSGWIVADGTSGTLDLRGVFLRGMGGISNGRDVSRTLGDYQSDDFKTHTHQYENNKSGHGLREGTLDRNTYEKPWKTYTNYNTTSAGGTETRPKNVAVLFCIKQ